MSKMHAYMLKFNRDIEFRGYNKTQKKWVFGLLVEHTKKRSVILENGHKWLCDHNSIGQFTGARTRGKNRDLIKRVLHKSDGSLITLSDGDELNSLHNGKGNSYITTENTGHKVYEGDIVTIRFTNGKRKRNGNLYWETVRALVVYDHGVMGWNLQRIQAGREYGSYYGKKMHLILEVIGNATEDPELLVDERSNGKHVGALDQTGALVSKRQEHTT